MKRTPEYSRQRGFSLLEVLVAMLILGVAVMGFAGLQVRALQSTGTAHIRSQAMTLASETVERIRSNSSAMSTYTTAAKWGTATIPSGDPSTWGSSCIKTSITSNGCTAVQMATFDIQEVQYIAQQLLPNGTVSVRNCAGGTLVTCAFVAWGSADAKTCVDNTSTNCVAMQVVAQ